MELLPPAPSVGDVPDDVSTVAYDSGDETVDYKGDGCSLTTTSSRFWGVTWNRQYQKWQARYTDADGKANGHGRPCDHRRRAKRRREEPAATPSTRARHQRRTVNYAEDPDYEP